MKIYLNGKIVDESEAKVSIFDRSYLFGDGLFETLRSYNGKLPFLEKHLNRMEWGATFMGLPFPYPKEIEEGILQTLQINKLENARVRIMLSGINQGLKPNPVSDDVSLNLVIVCEKFLPLPTENYEKGISLITVRSVKNEPSPVSNVKSASRATKMMARREIDEKKSFDGVLLNGEGFVAETTASNIFWVIGKQIYTPPPTVGLLQGITRDAVIELLKKEGITVKESFILPDEIAKADEIFLTGSTIKVLPVTRLDSHKIGNGKPGSMTQKVQNLYQARLKGEIE